MSSLLVSVKEHASSVVSARNVVQCNPVHIQLHAMQTIDLNLVVALDALLTEGSVTGAARRLHLSPSAMSRTLTRIRHVFKDPILVRAGRGLVRSPRAEQLRPQVRALIEQSQALLQPERLQTAQLERTFRIRATEAIPATFAAALLAKVHESAPRVRLTFVPEGEEHVDHLRDGRIDLDIGVADSEGPEIKAQALFRERMIGAVRKGHPILRGKVDARRYASYPHISASRRGRPHGPIDTELAAMDLKREVSMVVPSHSAALMIAAGSDMIASIGASLARYAISTGVEIQTFELPLKTEPIIISQVWHPRFDADIAHRWLRQQVRDVFSQKSASNK
jgi:DNA-binding transcriptional LysR family regulator